MQKSRRSRVPGKVTMEVEVMEQQQDSADEAGLDDIEAAVAAADSQEENENDNVNTSDVDMLQEHVYNNEDGSVDLAPELNVDENTILLPVAGENGLNADDPAIPFSASDFLQEEEEVIDPMETHIMEEEDVEEEDESPITRSNRRSPDYHTTFHPQLPKKRRDAASIKYEPEDEVVPERKKRRGRKPGSKVINGQVYYPEEDGLTYSKYTPKGLTRIPKAQVRPSSRQIKEEMEDCLVDDNQCRVCTSTTDLFSIFKKEHTKTYADKLMAFCPTVVIQRKDFLPQFICQVCANSVNAAFALKEQCEQTDLEFRERLESATKKPKRPVSTSYAMESEPEEYVELANDQEFKLSDASPPSADDSDSDYGKPLSKRRSRRRKNARSVKSQKKSSSASPAKRVIKTELDLNASKSSELEVDAGAVDFSSGSEEDYSPPKKRGPRKSKSIEGDAFPCRVCNEVLPSREELREHKKAMHTHFECELCGRKFRVQSSLKAHMDKHTQSGELKCEQCDKHFPNKTERRKHMVDVHNESPAQFVCEKCKRAFTTEVRLMKHNESRCPGFDTSQNKKRVDLESLAMGKDLFKCVAPLTTTYWSDSFSD